MMTQVLFIGSTVTLVGFFFKAHVYCIFGDYEADSLFSISKGSGSC